LIQVSYHGAAGDWVVCRIFKRTKPVAHHSWEDDDAEERPSLPSSASSCITDTFEAGDQEHDDDRKKKHRRLKKNLTCGP